jgi:hypothetical protein
MCLEPPESGLLSRPPRNVKKDRLANGRLLLQAYGILGVLESICAMAMWVSFSCILRFSLILTFVCAQVVLVLATARRTVLLAGLEVRELSRRAHERPAL